MQLVFPWLQFGLCVVAIGLAGPVLTRSGQAIARLTGMSASWVGLIMLATATSLPELFTGISAVTVADAPNIAMGDALGSCIFNLVMVAVLDTLSRDTPVWRRIDQGHILTASFGIILISFVGVLTARACASISCRTVTRPTSKAQKIRLECTQIQGASVCSLPRQHATSGRRRWARSSGTV